MYGVLPRALEFCHVQELLVTMEEAFQFMKLEEPALAKVMKRTKFYEMRPWWVKDATTSMPVNPRK